MIGESDKVTSIPILAATVPGQPQPPIMKSQSKIHLEIQWSDPIDLGGTALDAYIIEMDSGSSQNRGVFTVMNVQANTPSDVYYTQTYLDSTGNVHNLIAGDFYLFRVTARNIIGDSLASNELEVMAATLPGKPGIPSRLTSTEVSITL